MRALIGILGIAILVTGSLCGRGYQSAGPLCPCTVSFTERGGVDPIYYTYRQKNELRNIVALCESVVEVDAINADIGTFQLEGTLLTQTESVRAEKFHDQFNNVPWLAGGEISFALTCNTEVFIDGHYTKAQGRSESYTVNFPAVAGQLNVNGFTTPTALKPAETVVIDEDYSDLESYGGHLGCRYYFPQCWGCLSSFVGVKVGFRHWDTLKADITATFTDSVNDEQVIEHKVNYYPDHDVVSGGFQLGINLCVSNCLSFVIMAEAVGVGAFKFGRDTEFDRGQVNRIANPADPVGATEAEIREASTILVVPVRRTGTIITYPLTFGIRLTF